jgi:protein phosphatase
MDIAVPELALVILVGASGSGKSTFAARHFGEFETISSDFCRGLVSDSTTDQTATADAFAVLHEIAARRLDRGLLTVVDSTAVQPAARKTLVELAKAHDVLPVAIVLDLPEDLCVARNRARGVPFGDKVVRHQVRQLRQSLKRLGQEGIREVHHLTTSEEVEAATVRRTKLYNNRRDDHGPFDVIGDVHGCLDELVALLAKLGYAIVTADGRPVDAVHPEGRRAVFLGDLVDRGPNVTGVLRLAMGMTAAGHALAVPGNHEAKLVRALGRGSKVQISHGLAETLAQLAAEGPEFTAAVRAWCDALVSHYVLDDGRLVVAHAGLKAAYQGRASGRVRSFALYGDTTGESDEFGLPVRYPWAEDYRGQAMVLYGHTPVPEPEWVNQTLCLDTGCVFGGRLSALRYPEKELVQVAAARVYAEPVRPLVVTPERDPDVLDATDVLGKRVVTTRWLGRVIVQADQAAGAFEVMSRFAAAPSRLAYLPPTMAAVDSSAQDGYLEHPAEAFAYFARQGVGEVVCEEKHMGSRAVVWLQAHGGIIHTRTGRPFFAPDLERAALDRLRAAVTAAGLDGEWGDWVLLDAELLPWSVKAEGLLREQYRPVAASAAALYAAVTPALAAGAGRGLDVASLTDLARHRQADAAAFGTVLERYAWPTAGLEGVQVAPFQVLASARGAHYAEPHRGHMATAERLAAADPAFIRPTCWRALDPADPAAVAAAVTWWEELTAAGGEGMVVKPAASPWRAKKGLVQPGLKVRGREYLRITYGPGYLDHLPELRQRHLAPKRSLALREYALGLEAIDRLVDGAPLWQRHEAVFAVLALESEPTDPRL